MYTLERPIDTFIVLFVLLVIVFVVVQLVVSNGGESVSKVQQTEREMALQANLLDAKRFCNAQCNEVIAQGCTDRAVAEYCTARIDTQLDFNLNDQVDYDDTYFNGLGVCEDSVYCPQLTDCFCREKITMISCAETLCSYYETEQDLDADAASALVERVLSVGTCDAAQTNWATILRQSGHFTCS